MLARHPGLSCRLHAGVRRWPIRHADRQKGDFMKRTHAAAVLAGLLALTGCSNAPALTPLPRFAVLPVRANGAEVPAGLDGSTILESRQPGGIVFVVAEPNFADFGASFVVATHNKGTDAYTFGPANVEATANGRKLVVLGAEELDDRANGRARSYIRANTQTGAVDLDRASESFNREYRFNNYGGCPMGQGGCQIEDPAAGTAYRQDRIAREREAQTVAEVAANLAINKSAISHKALRTTSVGPNQLVGGIIVVEPPREGGQVELVVTINGKKHRFGYAAKPLA
jgi:hypothetical protein